MKNFIHLTLSIYLVYNRISFLQCAFHSNYSMIVTNLVCNRHTGKPGPETLVGLQWGHRKTTKPEPQRDPRKSGKPGSQRDPRKTRKSRPQWDPRKTGKPGPQRDPRNSLSLSFWWSLHKFHKYISFTSQIVRLTASGP